MSACMCMCVYMCRCVREGFGPLFLSGCLSHGWSASGCLARVVRVRRAGSSANGLQAVPPRGDRARDRKVRMHLDGRRKRISRNRDYHSVAPPFGVDEAIGDASHNSAPHRALHIRTSAGGHEMISSNESGDGNPQGASLAPNYATGAMLSEG